MFEVPGSSLSSSPSFCQMCAASRWSQGGWAEAGPDGQGPEDPTKEEYENPTKNNKTQGKILFYDFYLFFY